MSRPSSGRNSWAHRCAGLVVALGVSLVLSSCQSTADPSAAPERLSRGDGQVALAAHPLETTTRIDRIYGSLPPARRTVVRRQVGAVVDRWWDAAYLGGVYPRSGFPSAFPGFTDAATRRAQEDKALLTNQTRGPYVDSVTPTRRTVTLDVLATGRRARTVTAHVVLRFETTGTRAGAVVVRGRLFLIHKRGAWRVFGYDISKGVRR